MASRLRWKQDIFAGSNPASLTLLGIGLDGETEVLGTSGDGFDSRIPNFDSSGGTVGSAAKLLTSCGESLRRFDSCRWSLSTSWQRAVAGLQHQCCR